MRGVGERRKGGDERKRMGVGKRKKDGVGKKRRSASKLRMRRGARPAAVFGISLWISGVHSVLPFLLPLLHH